ncbi:glycosyltransferase family 4 protein [Streptococcus suis]|uniref:Glycosyltransferase n=1 Tax=Streptococcus suis TaxID=1307 RepID=M1VNY7_STRSU|nr:glycosyltransferase family 4 protein [Streptococcus suis]AGB58272.1 putative glycosyltransferase [Streptococcus suis]MCK3965944.1 glycosyltransferase family 4 protein [Streptococcus suis]MDY7601469.1 glycosyltransferase family 4 protein [Streptococcus suis]NQM44379.1 glycosyltransferase family 4 protein [Streptococcus suis]BAM94717.1 glycosyltransferase [Streptococcus suis]
MKAIFVMSTSFPYGEAFSSRSRNLVKLLCECGYHVHVIAPNSVGQEDCPELSEYKYSVTHIRDPKNIFTLSGFGTAKPYLVAVNDYLKSNKIDLIVSSSMTFVADQLRKVAVKENVPYIVEQCEWYDSSTFRFGKWNPYYREHIRRIEKKNMKVDGIIAISRLFEQHYSFMKVPTFRIPTILDVKNIEFRYKGENEKKYHIVFAGSLGKGKEKMEPIFSALKKVNRSETKIVFDIYGANEQGVLDNIDGNKELWEDVRPFVNVHGYILQNEVENVVRDADFTIFIRPIRRSSNAGFPTKFAESMAVGTPVITNNTGDIGLYLEDRKNGFLLGSGSEMEIVNAFESIISCEHFDYIEMRKCARKTAENYFDYTRYVENMKKFLKQFN